VRNLKYDWRCRRLNRNMRRRAKRAIGMVRAVRVAVRRLDSSQKNDQDDTQKRQQ